MLAPAAKRAKTTASTKDALDDRTIQRAVQETLAQEDIGMKRGFDEAELSNEGAEDEAYIGYPYAMFLTQDGRDARISTTLHKKTRFIACVGCWDYFYAEHGGGVTLTDLGLVPGKTTQMVHRYPGWIFHLEDYTQSKPAVVQVWCEPKPDEEEITRVKKYAQAVVAPA